MEIVALNSGVEHDDVSSDVNIQAPIDTNVDEATGAITAITSATLSGAVDPDKAVDANNKLIDLVLNVFNLQPLEESEEPEEPEQEEAVLGEMAERALERVKAGEVDAVDAFRWLAGEVTRNGR